MNKHYSATSTSSPLFDTARRVAFIFTNAAAAAVK